MHHKHEVKKRVKSLSTPEGMRGSGGMALFILNLGSRLRCSASHPELFFPKETIPSTHWKLSWVGPSAGVDNLEKRSISYPRQESNQKSLDIQPVALWLYQAHYPGPYNKTQCCLKLKCLGVSCTIVTHAESVGVTLHKQFTAFTQPKWS